MGLHRKWARPWPVTIGLQLQKRQIGKKTSASPEKRNRILAIDRRAENPNTNAGEYKVHGFAAESLDRQR